MRITLPIQSMVDIDFIKSIFKSINVFYMYKKMQGCPQNELLSSSFRETNPHINNKKRLDSLTSQFYSSISAAMTFD